MDKRTKWKGELPQYLLCSWSNWPINIRFKINIKKFKIDKLDKKFLITLIIFIFWNQSFFENKEHFFIFFEEEDSLIFIRWKSLYEFI